MREAFIINGLGGKKLLEGSIAVRGAKNAALQAMAFSALFKDGLSISNWPDISDVWSMADLLKGIGAVLKEEKGKLNIFFPENITPVLDKEIAQKMRASIVLIGPLLSRYGKVTFPHPGGCVIGKRPIDIFLKGFEKMGAKISGGEFGYTLSTGGKKLKGADIFFRIPSVTATQTLMLAGVLAEGKTVLKNVAMEPEITTFADFLNMCGADISGAGTSTITVKGRGLLSSGGNVYKVPPDRIEAGSFIILGALCAKRLVVKNCEPKHLDALIESLRQVGVSLDIGKNSVTVNNIGGASKLEFENIDIKTREYPGFPTDLQAPMVVFLSQARGESLVFETIFEGRLNYVSELVRMGADIRLWDPHHAIVNGPTPLRGRELESPDIRAGLAYIIAAVLAEGQSVIHGVNFIDRGYERIESRLSKIGVDIRRVEVE